MDWLALMHRRYRETGVPRLEQQALDLSRLVLADHAEQAETVGRAVAGYVNHKREHTALRSKP